MDLKGVFNPLIVLGGGGKNRFSYNFYDAKTTRYTHYTHWPLEE